MSQGSCQKVYDHLLKFSIFYLSRSSESLIAHSSNSFIEMIVQMQNQGIFNLRRSFTFSQNILYFSQYHRIFSVKNLTQDRILQVRKLVFFVIQRWNLKAKTCKSIPYRHTYFHVYFQYFIYSTHHIEV